MFYISDDKLHYNVNLFTHSKTSGSATLTVVHVYSFQNKLAIFFLPPYFKI